MICYSFRLRHSIPQNGAQLALTTLLHQECPWPVQALAEPAYDSNSFEKTLPTIFTSREAGLILH